jgi:hypothetical protein
MEGGNVSVVRDTAAHVAETVITVTFPPPAAIQTYFTHPEDGNNTFLRNIKINSAKHME